MHDRSMRDDAEPRRQSLFPAFFFSVFGLEINVIRIFELPVPLATKLAEMRPIALFAVAHVFDHFKVGLGTQVFNFNLKLPPCCQYSPVIGEGFSLISSAEERLGSSWQSSGAVVRCFADVASPVPSFAQPLD
jgi:hypothetical protein